MTKDQFVQHLFDKNLLWSFDRKQADQLSDPTIIEHALLFGDVDEYKSPFTHGQEGGGVDSFAILWRSIVLTGIARIGGWSGSPFNRVIFLL